MLLLTTPRSLFAPSATCGGGERAALRYTIHAERAIPRLERHAACAALGAFAGAELLFVGDSRTRQLVIAVLLLLEKVPASPSWSFWRSMHMQHTRLASALSCSSTLPPRIFSGGASAT